MEDMRRGVASPVAAATAEVATGEAAPRLALLQALRLKGVASPAALAEALAWDPGATSSRLEALVAAGCAERSPRGFRLAAAGRRELAAGLAAERARLVAARIEALYRRFEPLDRDFKQIVTDWQLRAQGGALQPNDHSDAEYDRSVLERFHALHAPFIALVAEVARSLPRLAPYGRRFEAARARVAAGEHRYLAAPAIESYHTVWFEFHEELIGASGRKRAEEAAAGRAG